ncbi:ribose-phosphate diphosphokinase [Ramlibacter sp. MMS24-I3-19]|uniref:ribose-phosphate diphosphokinase n=1 Tax=Ramlibacter sp. MMS24-I3-19 TaxID=3416606 RepID=UPI003CFCDC22
MSVVVLPLPGAEAQAASLAQLLDATAGSLEFRRFPDGESYYRIASDVSDCDVVVVGALRDPDPLALGLWYVADTAREMGARRIGLVAPYLPYMRQDARFRDGEAVTSRSFGRFVSQAFDWLVTVDPHLHRYPTLDIVYSIPSVVVPSAPAIARWLQANVTRPVVIGPDSESEQWAGDVARRVGCPSQVLTKTRLGDRHVEISLPEPGLAEGRQPVLVDDIISSGHTMAEAVRHVRSAFGAAPLCVGVHALFAPEARRLLLDAGASQVLTCNTVPDASNAVDVLPDIAAAVRPLLQAGA